MATKEEEETMAILAEETDTEDAGICHSTVGLMKLAHIQVQIVLTNAMVTLTVPRSTTGREEATITAAIDGMGVMMNTVG